MAVITFANVLTRYFSDFSFAFTEKVSICLMVTCRITGATIESTVPWVLWLILTMFLTLVLVIAVPERSLWLPRYFGFL